MCAVPTRHAEKWQIKEALCKYLQSAFRTFRTTPLPNRIMKPIFYFLTLIAAAAPLRAAELAAAPAPATNPLKGFLPYAGDYEFPHSMEWFYLPLSALQTDTNRFDWQPLESKLNAIAARGHQAVFRVYLDYPQTPYGVPKFLAQVPKRAYSEHGNGKNPQRTSFSPDYDHPDLRRALKSFIKAWGARYDGDARIGFITVGLLGFWGEWHTYPHSGEGDDFMAAPVVQNEVLDAFATAFSKTKLLLREPKANIGIEKRALGFHDDSFAYQTLGPKAWHLWPRVQNAGLTEIWKTQPIGGEVRPEVQKCLWNADAENCVPQGQEFARCVAVTHASWLLNQGAFGDLNPEQKRRAIAGAQSLGYEFWVRAAHIARRDGRLEVEVSLVNRGVAPFYYDWPLELALVDKNNAITARWTTDWKLSTVLPNAPQTWKFAAAGALPNGNYRLLLRVINPLPNGQTLRFANQTQDQNLRGWLTLAPVVFEEKQG